MTATGEFIETTALPNTTKAVSGNPSRRVENSHKGQAAKAAR